MSAARDKAAHALERARKNYSGLVRAHAAHEQDRGRPPTAPPVQATVIRAQFDVDENGIVGAAPPPPGKS